MSSDLVAPLPGAAALADEMDRAVRGEAAVGPPSLDGLVVRLAGVNLRQWDLEDTTRDPAASDHLQAIGDR